jgi:ribosomal protein S18 acetylase RimI-like enzyme
MLRIRKMRSDDVSFAIRLSDQEKWGIPARDLERILRLDPRGSFVAIENARRVGLATTTSYGKQLAWIGNVVVEKSRRGKHIGQALVKHAIGYLTKTGVKRIVLYSFDENIEFYRKLGFIQGPRFARFRRERQQLRSVASEADTPKPMTMPALLAIDKKAFGADRSRLLVALLNSGAASYLGYSVRSRCSYLLAKDYEDMLELGPWISFGLRPADLESMLRLALDKAKERPIEITCPLTNSKPLAILSKSQFQTINEGHVMGFRRYSKIGQPNAIVACGFIDKG